MRLIIGMSGASGAPLTVALLKKLQQFPEVESHFVMSESARLTVESETGLSVEQLCELADVVYEDHRMGAQIASGSFGAEGMIVVPCSMKTVAGIACGYSENLLLRAADVTIKEGRKLVLVARETPFSPIHLQNMLTLSRMGVRIMPPMMNFYNGAQSLDAQVDAFCERLLMQFGLSTSAYEWPGM
jgi:4-hydroxy-3-polyprenylbenzoate decarboxylase